MSEVAQNGLGAQEQSEKVSKSSEPINFLHHCPHCGSNKFEAHGTKEFICGACDSYSLAQARDASNLMAMLLSSKEFRLENL